MKTFMLWGRCPWFALLALLCLVFTGCSQEIPAAHKGRMFEKTGFFALYSGAKGFSGPVLGPGTHVTGMYNELRVVECAQTTVKEAMTALTKDGVQFGLDLYIRYSANCDEGAAVEALLVRLVPEPVPPPKSDTAAHQEPVITSAQLYNTFVRPALGEAVREAVSPHIANELNARREEIFATVRTKFEALMQRQKPLLVLVGDLNLSNLDFPEEMDRANNDRAVQAVLKDKAIAERERVTAEIDTTEMRNKLAQKESDNEVTRITTVGKALKAYPEYLQYDAQNRWNDIYFHAGEHGNLILAAPVPSLVLPARK